MSGNSLGAKFVRRVKSGDLRNAAYLSYFYTYLKIIDIREGTHLAGSTRASDLGGSDADSTGNFPAHPQLVRKMLGGIPHRETKKLMDVGCGSGSVLRVALELGFAEAHGIELFESVAARAQSYTKDPRCQVKVGDAMTADLSGFDVLTFYRPFPSATMTRELVERWTPEWLLLGHLEEYQPEGYQVRMRYRHPIYEPFVFRLLERSS